MQVTDIEGHLLGSEAAPDDPELPRPQLSEKEGRYRCHKPKLLKVVGAALAIVLLASAPVSLRCRGAAAVLEAIVANEQQPLEDWRDPLDPGGRPGRLPGEHRTVTLAGFYRSELNARYTERFGKEYVVNGEATYWGPSQELFLYSCNYTNQWIISTADKLEGIRDQRRCDYTAKGPKGRGILDYDKPRGWSEWLDGELADSPMAGVHVISTEEWLAQDNQQHDTLDIYPHCKRPPYSSIPYMKVYTGQLSRRDELVSNVQYNQGTCNACWATTITSVVERLLCITSEGKFQGLAAALSPAYITSCASPAIVGKDGCDVGGGRALEALRWVGKHGVPTGGSSSEYWTCVPFFPVNHTSPTAAPPCPKKCTSPDYPRSLREDLFTPAGLEYSYETTAVESAKAALDHGPILILIPIYEDFLDYTGGVYEHKTGKYMGPHFMIAHGYTAEYFQGFNSWGTQWGFQGTYRVKVDFPTSFVIPGWIKGIGEGFPYPLPLIRQTFAVRGFADERLNGDYKVWPHELGKINGQSSAWKGDDSILYRCEPDGFWAIYAGFERYAEKAHSSSTQKERVSHWASLQQQLEKECRWNAHAPPRPPAPLLQCSAWVVVTGAEDVQPLAMGNFTMVQEQRRTGRPVYQNGHGQRLYFFRKYNNWRIGPDPTSELARVMEVPARNADCPNQVQGWQVYNNGWSEEFEIKVAAQHGAETDWVELVDGKEVLRPGAGVYGL